MKSIQILRVIAGLSASDLAKQASVAPSTLSRIERGRQEPSDRLALRLLSTLEDHLDNHPPLSASN
ncbi:MAG: helix-turn-helix transcriptional regulator [Dehalococcoidia bacterium]|jgi:transcriptional regulator with XRE-family HTH domain